MSDARWTDVELDVENACKHFRNAAAILDGGGFDQDGLAGYIQEMALMHAMQSGHTSMEGALLRVLDILDEDKPTGDRRHEDLIRRAARPIAGSRARPAILSPDAAAAADETRRFRNKATRGYSSFVASRAAPALEAARHLVEALPRDVARFRQEIDPPSDDAEDDRGPRTGGPGPR
jgi:hypothetical protein